uniref:CUB domain-containing protein n=1 Tax=Romanomermis culicivorax TaxID=13658 RepID=A0A915KZM1_ROMCU
KSCGGRIFLTSDRASHISTPGWPYLPFSSLPKGQECFWLITAPAGAIVQMWIEGSSPALHAVKFLVTSSYLFDIARSRSFCIDYLEVKNSSDFANTGMRFCGDIPPAGPIYSETNEMVVIFRAHRYNSRGFRANLYAVKPEDKKKNEELLVHDFFTHWSTYDY